jgi:hypothetical protein
MNLTRQLSTNCRSRLRESEKRKGADRAETVEKNANEKNANHREGMLNLPISVSHTGCRA